MVFVWTTATQHLFMQLRYAKLSMFIIKQLPVCEIDPADFTATVQDLWQSFGGNESSSKHKSKVSCLVMFRYGFSFIRQQQGVAIVSFTSLLQLKYCGCEWAWLTFPSLSCGLSAMPASIQYVSLSWSHCQDLIESLTGLFFCHIYFAIAKFNRKWFTSQSLKAGKELLQKVQSGRHIAKTSASCFPGSRLHTEVVLAQ